MTMGPAPSRPTHGLPGRAMACLFALVLPWAGTAAEPGIEPPGTDLRAGDKSRYTLFNPTPRALMRELSTDRPDLTESAYTVDAGHLQIEMDLVGYTHDTSGGTTLDAWAIAPINFKIGLLNSVDLQTVIETYNDITVTGPGGAKATQSGFGDITSRLKVNLWGNDGGATALALMPYVKYPTSQDGIGNDSVEGGLIAPMAVELPAGFGMGIMTQFDWLRDAADDGYHAEFVNSITVSHDIVGNLGGYVEFWTAVSTDTGAAWIGSLDLGLTFGIGENMQLDAGVNIGVTDSADALNPFVGLSVRF